MPGCKPEMKDKNQCNFFLENSYAMESNRLTPVT